MCKEPLNSKYCGTDDKEKGREGKRYHLGKEEGVIQDGQGHKGDDRESRSPRQGRERSRENPFGNQDPCWFLQSTSEMGQGVSILTFIRLMRILKSRTAMFQ